MKPGRRPPGRQPGDPRITDIVPAGHQRGDVMPKERLKVVLDICEAVASGGKISELLGKNRQAGWPSYVQWGKWMGQFPAVREAYRTARELSAQVMEDRALGVVDTLLDPGAEYTNTFVAAAGKAMEQLRWSAERRDPGSFGAKAEAQTIVPIQINTTLDLGQSGVLGTPPPDAKTDWGYEVIQQPTPEPLPAPADDPAVPPNRFGITELPVSDIKRNLGGRPRKGHNKDARTVKKTLTEKTFLLPKVGAYTAERLREIMAEKKGQPDDSAAKGD